VPLKLFVCRFVPVQNPDDDGHLSAAAFATAFILSLPCWTKRNSPPIKGQFTKTSYQGRHGQMGSADPPGKMDEKLKSENMQKEQFPTFVLLF